MRKLIAFIILPIFLLVASCESFIEGYDESPNSPTEATVQLLMSVSQVSTFMYYTGQLARTPAILMQQCAGTDFQMIDVRDYVLLEGDNTNEWEGIYSNCLINEQLILETYGEDNPHYAGVAKVLQAMAVGLLTDLWGDVPYREALQGLKGQGDELHPAFDPQQQVIGDIQQLLTDAIADLSKPATDNLITPGDDDYIYGGDVDAWIDMAWVLKARYANRLSKKNANGSATDALNYLSKVDLTSPDNFVDALAIFGDEANEQNQWFDFQNDRGDYIQMGEFFVDMLNSNSDPRVSFFATTDSGGVYNGTATNARDTWTSDFGSYAGTEAGQDMPLVTFFEAKFIEAEANLRLGNDAEAAAAYNEAVKASVLIVTGAADAAFETDHASETAGTISLETIMNQKYVAMFTQPEVWSDWRRTGFPVLTPNPDSDIAGIPRRLPTCQTERQYNTSAVVESNVLVPVWWDE